MSYNPLTDFLGIWRNIAGQVSKVEMPGLDYVVASLARAGFITLSIGAAAPVANQSVTAWLQTAVPSYSAEGTMFLWNPVTAAYVPATPALLIVMLQTAAGQNGVSWYEGNAVPANVVGNNGDFFILSVEPGGIYGPKTLGAWPAAPLPGTTDIIGSTQLDQTFGMTEGALIIRGPAVWQALEIGAANTLPVSNGMLLSYQTLSALLDTVFGNAQGSLLYRDVAVWNDLPPGVANQVLSTNGPGANPAWSSRTAEFPSGTVMVFQQSAAPPGWTKQTAINDYGLRVTSGAVGVTVGSAFSTVFAQTAVGDTTITTATMPSHTHTYTAYGSLHNDGTQALDVPVNPSSVPTGSTGGDGSHNHSINLTLSYVDVIIASKN